MKHTKTTSLMGTEITITIFGEENPMNDINNAFGIFHSLEVEFSRFSQNSSLSMLNQQRSLKVSDRFIEVMRKSKEIYFDTNKYFNPLINLRQIGYTKAFSANEFQKEEIQVNLDFESIQIFGNRITLQEGQTLDLGGIVKGFGGDEAKKYLDEKKYKNYIIDAGGDIYTSGRTDTGKKILVGIDSPFIKGDLSATLELENSAIATSGNYKRKWKIGDQEYNHIINPLTGSNNNEIISISLIADHCYLADAYATACIAMGLEKALHFLEDKKIEGVIIGADKKIYKTKGIEGYNLQLFSCI